MARYVQVEPVYRQTSHCTRTAHQPQSLAVFPSVTAKRICTRKSYNALYKTVHFLLSVAPIIKAKQKEKRKSIAILVNSPAAFNLCEICLSLSFFLLLFPPKVSAFNGVSEIISRLVSGVVFAGASLTSGQRSPLRG